MTLHSDEPSTVDALLSAGPIDGAEAFVEQLVASGIDTIYLNSGTDTFPVQEAIVKRRAVGLPAPRVVLCLDETVAAAAAHGHFMVSGRPQMVLVHVDVGTLQIGGALHNAQRGRAAMVICAGRAPYTTEGDVRGARSRYIHWAQEQLDQHGIVRNYTKWDYELRRTENVHQIVQRAVQIASSSPPGPVYLTLPPEVLLQRITDMKMCPPDLFQPIPAPPPHAALIERAAELLAGAEAPLIVVGNSGRNTAAVAPLIALAESLGAPVYGDAERMSFPTTHALYADIDATDVVDQADVILCIDSTVPYIPMKNRPASGAKVIEIGVDPLNASIPLLGFPVNVAIAADSAIALEKLVAAVQPRINGSALSLAARRATIEAANAIRRDAWKANARSRAGEVPIHPEYLVTVLDEVIDETWTVIEEAVGGAPLVARLLRRTKPGSMFKSGGTSLGWALGAALGAKIADPSRTIVALVGDGTFVYGCPTAALWAADVERAPFLTVIFNNRVHNATRNALKFAYPNSFSERTGDWRGVVIDPPPDYAAIARGSRAYGERVEDPAQLRPALERAISALRNGQAAVVDVLTNVP